MLRNERLQRLPAIPEAVTYLFRISQPRQDSFKAELQAAGLNPTVRTVFSEAAAVVVLLLEAGVAQRLHPGASVRCQGVSGAVELGPDFFLGVAANLVVAGGVD